LFDPFTPGPRISDGHFLIQAVYLIAKTNAYAGKNVPQAI